MSFTDDPVADFHRHDARQQKELDAFPKCCECEERIVDIMCFEYNGNPICDDCMKTYHRCSIEEFM
jgi:formylmethanofuran dehydrogenase subunit E